MRAVAFKDLTFGSLGACVGQQRHRSQEERVNQVNKYKKNGPNEAEERIRQTGVVLGVCCRSYLVSYHIRTARHVLLRLERPSHTRQQYHQHTSDAGDKVVGVTYCGAGDSVTR